MMLLLTLLLSVTLATLTSGQLQCHVEGQCSGIFVGTDNTDNYNECLDRCKANSACQWITYLGDTMECIEMSDCPEINSNCDNCHSGQSDCPQHEPSCNQVGICNGHFLSAGHASSADRCLELCQSMDECRWYSYFPDLYNCILTADCPEVDSSCSDCSSGESDCPLAPAPHLMFVVGGAPETANNKVEVVDVKSGRTCVRPADIPVQKGGVGGFVEDKALVCGGFVAGVVTANCYEYSVSEWVQSGSLGQERAFAAAVMLSPTEWWVTGGQNLAGQMLRTSELYTVGQGFAAGPDLPSASVYHDLVKINDTHVMMIADSSLVYMFDRGSETWSTLPRPPVQTYGSFSGVVTSPEGKKEVVLAAGSSTADTQVFDLDSQLWRLSPAFPAGKIYDGTSVAYEDSFVVVGGFDGSAATDGVFVFDAVAKGWNELSQKLVVPREDFTAFLVPDDFVSCA